MTGVSRQYGPCSLSPDRRFLGCIKGLVAREWGGALVGLCGSEGFLVWDRGVVFRVSGCLMPIRDQRRNISTPSDLVAAPMIRHDCNISTPSDLVAAPMIRHDYYLV